MFKRLIFISCFFYYLCFETNTKVGPLISIVGFFYYLYPDVIQHSQDTSSKVLKSTKFPDLHFYAGFLLP